MSYPNKFPGTCRTCSKYVTVAAGVTLKQDGRWIVECSACSGSRPASPERLQTSEPTIDVAIEDEQITLRPLAFLGGALFDAFREATTGATYDREAKINRAPVDVAAVIFARLRAASFRLNVTPEVVARLQAYEAGVASDTAGADARADEVDVLLRERGRANHPLDHRVMELLGIKAAIIAASIDAAADGEAAPAAATMSAADLAAEGARAAADVAEARRRAAEALAKAKEAAARAERDREISERDRGRRDVTARAAASASNRGWLIPREAFATPLRAARTAREEWAAAALAHLVALDSDRARWQNDAGFSASDTSTGHPLAAAAAAGQLNDGEWQVAINLAWRYPAQVGRPADDLGPPRWADDAHGAPGEGA